MSSALSRACEKLAAAMDVEDYESEGGDVSGEEMGAPPSLLAFEGGVVSGSLEVEAGALGQVLDLSVPLSEWLSEAAKRADARLKASGAEVDRQERNLWSLCARLAGCGLLGAGAPSQQQLEPSGREEVGRGSCTAAVALGDLNGRERSRRERCAVEWLEECASEAVKYFVESEVDTEGVEGDCVEGAVARASAFGASDEALLRCCGEGALRAAEDERRRVGTTYVLWRAGRHEDAFALNFRSPKGAWRAAALKGGSAWGAVDWGDLRPDETAKVGNRRLGLWRACARARCLAALETGERLVDSRAAQAGAQNG